MKRYNFVDYFCDVLYEPFWRFVRIFFCFYCSVKSFGQVVYILTNEFFIFFIRVIYSIDISDFCLALLSARSVVLCIFSRLFSYLRLRFCRQFFPIFFVLVLVLFAIVLVLLLFPSVRFLVVSLFMNLYSVERWPARFVHAIVRPDSPAECTRRIVMLTI